ncbi:sulfotransferase family 2 domain-containing protein [Pantoea ananatis]|uniref:sulfotransferase family 2 domain-containing protein n=1 Tax=Pantoea ananas TaxID=553 RepID=UPI002350EEEC|nr:sulfotransferase family 2 domain-containing protein [Pantoea ananatis]MDC7859347.1 hypothetical protein [Pantoea ananatis]
MIFSHEKRFLFIHNPKVAGTSVRNALKKYDSSNGIYWRPYYLERQERIIDRAHIPASEYDVNNLQEIADAYFTFGFVRNPYQKVLSAWDEFRLQHDVGEQMDINEWIANNLTEVSIRYDWRLIHFCPQHYFFYINNKCVADFIGKQETIEFDWFKIQKLIGINETLSVYNKKNKNTTPRNLKVFNELSLSMINSLYEKDFLLFDYEMVGEQALPDNNSYQKNTEELLIPQRKLHLLMNREITALLEQNEKKSDEIIKLQLLTDVLKNDISTLKNEVVKKNDELRSVYNSKSLKLTAPLRNIKRFIRHLRG